MYRRRRTPRAPIAFGFDSFLDLVANVIGIIIRLILVAWVGARAYQATMQWREDTPPEEVAALGAPDLPRETKPHPLEAEIESTRQDLTQARNSLFNLLDQVLKARSSGQAAQAEVQKLKGQQIQMALLAHQEEIVLKEAKAKVSMASLALGKLQDRGRDLLAQVRALEKEPAPKKLLRFRTPVSRTVEGEELMFECKGGRVTYLDVPALLHEVKAALNNAKLEEIAKAGSWTSTTPPVGAFRLRFTFEAQSPLFATPGNVSIRLVQWVVEPAALNRGETIEDALQAGSDFRRLVDGIDPQHTAVTFWVYPDSFALFRALRDHLYLAEVEVAGRPLPLEHPIGASIFGTRSRGQ